MVESAPYRRLSYGLAFSMSFCSFGYQQLMALALYDASGDFVLSQAFSLAAFLSGMGLGSLSAEKLTAPGWRRLLYIEWLQAGLGVLTVSYVHLCEFLFRYFFPGAPAGLLFALVLPWTALFGWINGLELPCLLRLNPQLTEARLLGWNYIGALAAAICVPIYLIPLLDLPGCGWLLGLLSVLIGAVLFPLGGRGAFDVAVSALLLLLVALWFRLEPAWRDVHLKSIYMHPVFSTWSSVREDFRIFSLLETPLRERSAYQWIDVVPPEFGERVQGAGGYTLFLDRKFQFSSITYTRYHQSMVHGGALLLASPPERVLILGGGDGLLLPEIFKHPSVGRVDLVELDPRMIELAQQDPRLREMNHGALSDPRVHVHQQDAFQYVRQSAQTYDLILIDLPYPVSYDLSLLFTKEFYAHLLKRLAPAGLVVLDFPAGPSTPEAFAVLLHTLRAAGFAGLSAFGADETFVLATREKRSFVFDFNRLDPLIDNQAVLNFISRQDEADAALAHPARVNSVFFPLRFNKLEQAQ